MHQIPSTIQLTRKAKPWEAHQRTAAAILNDCHLRNRYEREKSTVSYSESLKVKSKLIVSSYSLLIIIANLKSSL